jgi:hypothetical protein
LATAVFFSFPSLTVTRSSGEAVPQMGNEASAWSIM